ncbi:hypothetical protein GLA29479_4081 [Lysobacter antibioticus]|uniref:Uncharacterized protein n=1 Tax=Lysobacter antibioticus TaxID=84531 RepID=A0A0S2F4C0_LYSAN|nr:hypothetical protein GLA29479_4081 [Lysobacter antibioticus]ALN78412.1 hypothetical protein LA76x_0250 [Lysobacter antibioticus]
MIACRLGPLRSGGGSRASPRRFGTSPQVPDNAGSPQVDAAGGRHRRAGPPRPAVAPAAPMADRCAPCPTVTGSPDV